MVHMITKLLLFIVGLPALYITLLATTSLPRDMTPEAIFPKAYMEMRLALLKDVSSQSVTSDISKHIYDFFKKIEEDYKKNKPKNDVKKEGDEEGSVLNIMDRLKEGQEKYNKSLEERQKKLDEV